MSKILPNNLNLFDKNTFVQLPSEKKSDKQFILSCLKRNGLLFEFLSEEQKRDKEIILEAFKQDEDIFEFIPEFLKRDIDFLVELVIISPSITYKFDYEFRNNRRIILSAIDGYGVDALWEMELKIFQDVEIIVTALKSAYGQHIWEDILCGAGDLAEFSKSIIEAGYILYGDKVLEMSYNDLENDRQVVESVIKRNKK